MLWFKHYTDSLDDPFIQGLLDEFGAKGYLAYFGLLEIIAKENGNKVTGELSINPTYLRRKLRISVAKLSRIYHHCDTSTKLSCNFSEKLWHFHIPKLSELKDNYTKDLQGSCKKLAEHKEVDIDKDKEKNQDNEKQPPPAEPKKTPADFSEKPEKFEITPEMKQAIADKIDQLQRVVKWHKMNFFAFTQWLRKQNLKPHQINYVLKQTIKHSDTIQDPYAYAQKIIKDELQKEIIEERLKEHEENKQDMTSVDDLFNDMKVYTGQEG